jgi:hypothetical protein
MESNHDGDPSFLSLPGKHEEFQDFDEVLRLIFLTKTLHYLKQTVDILEVIENIH